MTDAGPTTAGLPEGTVTFLFTDIEGSTRLAADLGDERWAELLQAHYDLLREAFEAHGGVEVKTDGDACFVAFETAGAGVRAAVNAQLALARHPWPHRDGLRVRMGVHTGAAHRISDDYVGLAVHRAARIADAAHGGQILISQATADLLEDTPPGDVELHPLGPHELKDFDVPVELLQLRHPDLQADFPPPRTEAASPTNLPVRLTSFVGRDEELRAVRKTLEDSRLVTLIGAGGAGKTRLALEAAADARGAFPDGVWWVDLAPLTDPDLVPREVARAMGLQEAPGSDGPSGPGSGLRRLADHLQRRCCLVVLDNCEHLLDACAELAEALLRGCPEVTLLATSREPLGIAGEITRRIPSLALPDPEAPPEEIAAAEAVRLFSDRARAVRDDFDLAGDEAGAAARICRRLDGIPLAIELAAARARSLSCVQIAERLDDRFRLLTGGARTAAPRQRTLEATVDWSHELLSEAERRLLRRVSGFAGGFTLESAEAVCSGAGVDELDVVDLLDALVDKSLIVADIEGSRTRYRLLETIRQYGRERLLAAGELEAFRTRHLEHFAALAEAEGPFVVEGPDQLRLLDRFEAEHDNFRAALGWATSAPEHAEEGLRLAAGLSWFWWVRGHLEEGRAWLARVLEGSAGSRTPDRALCLAHVGLFDAVTGRVDAAADVELAEEALGIVADLRGTEGIAFTESHALLVRGILPEETGEGDGRPWLHEALRVAREGGVFIREAAALHTIGMAEQRRGRLEEARRYYRESLAAARRIDARAGVLRSLSTLATLDRRQGDLLAARDREEQGLRLARELGDKIGVFLSLAGLTAVATASGRDGEARALGEELLVFARDWGNPSAMVGALIRVGYTHLWSRRWDAARGSLEEALEVSRTTEGTPDLAEVLHSLGELEEACGDLPAARRRFEQSLEVADATGGAEVRGEGLTSLGHVLRRAGETGPSRECFSEALGLERRDPVEARAVEGLAHLAADAGAWDRAARLLGAAEAGRNPVAYRAPVYDEEFEATMARGREALGPRFDELYEEGRALPAEEATTEALEIAETLRERTVGGR